MPNQKLGFHNLCKRVKGKAINNGHHPEFETTNKKIKLFNVPGQGHDHYVFKEIHVHTGALESAGSEHSIDNNFSPLEVHAVFLNEQYNDPDEAKAKSGGVTVIAVQVQIANEDLEIGDSVSLELRDKESSNQPCQCAPLDVVCRKKRCFCKGPNDLFCKTTKNQACSDKFGEGLVCRASGIGRCSGDEECSGLKKCRRNDFMQVNQAPNNYCSLPKICRVRYARELSHLMEKYYEKTRHYTTKTAPDAKKITRILENITPKDILPYSWNYYTYSGSLTAPPCYESVQWIVMRCPIKISRKGFLGIKQKYNSFRKSNLSSQFNGNLETEIATSELLDYYGCTFADARPETVCIPCRHVIQDFTYKDSYLKNYVEGKNRGAGLERHEFVHLDCPLDDDSGFFVLGKLSEDEFHLTAFRVPKRHTLYVPANCIHSNDYLKGTWRTMLSDESNIDQVFLKRKTKENGVNKLQSFTFSFAL
uniref:carbonic anhydrase n=1 Tax=Magallana gigas TaxID=29159 RepID=K1RKE6_MAGGI